MYRNDQFAFRKQIVNQPCPWNNDKYLNYAHTGSVRINAEPVSDESSDNLRQRFSVAKGKFTDVIIGRDWGLKLKQTDRFDLEKIFLPHRHAADASTVNSEQKRMKLYRLQRIQNLPISRNKAWRFFSHPLNLPEITPAWLGFRLNTAVPDTMFAGMVISYRIKPLFGIPATWISEITHVHEPEYFIDEQRFGPYRFWHHRHTFKPLDNGTQISDIVHYAIGFGMLDNWVQRLMVAPRLDNIFNYRYEKLKHIFTANTCELQSRIN